MLGNVLIERLAPLLLGCVLSAGMAAAQGTEYPAVKFRSNYLASYYVSHAPTTTPWAPCWSPDGKWIAFSMYGSIWKVDVASGEAYELTHSTKLHSNPSWSPDGKWIVYTADDNWRSIQLEILNVQTGETRALTQDTQVYLDPVFSPDGGRLAFVSTESGGNLNIAVRPIHNGDWSGQEVAVTRDHRFGKPRSYFDDWDLHIEPAWLKDGRELLLVSNLGVPLGSGKLWRAPVQPDAMSSARAILDEQSLYRTRPDVAPDGKRVVYSSSAGAADQFDHLYVLPVVGGQPYKLTFGDYDDFHPRWSPDGKWIAYISNKEGLPDLYLLETAGGGAEEGGAEDAALEAAHGRGASVGSR
jgi:Tol biopolymer transport system component